MSLESLPDCMISGIQALTHKDNHKGLVAGSFDALMPQSLIPRDTLEPGLTASISSKSMTLLSVLFFAMSNKHEVLDSKSRLAYYKWIYHNFNQELLEHLLITTGPTPEALLEELFCAAIEMEDTGTIVKILDTGIDPNELSCLLKSGQRGTPLQRACETSSIALTKALLEHGADANKALQSTDAPLKLVFEAHPRNECRVVDLVKVLLKAGARIGNRGESPLVVAVGWSMVKVISLLLQAGADPNSRSPYTKNTVLADALCDPYDSECTSDIVRALLEAGADASFIDGVLPESMVDSDLVSDSIGLIECLLRRGARPKSDDVRNAVHARSVDALKLLVEYGACITEEAIEDAAPLDDSNMMRFLLESKVSVTPKAIARAVESGSTEVVRLMLNSVAKTSKVEIYSAALTEAIRWGKKGIMDILFLSGVRLQAGEGLDVAVQSAVGRGDLALLQSLLKDDSPYRSSVAKSLGGSLCVAIAHGRMELIELLLMHDLDLDKPYHIGTRLTTPLMEAIEKEDISLTQRLLAAGAACNTKCKGATYSVLPAAISWGDGPCIRALIDAGANPNEKGIEDMRTALVVAVEKGDFEMMELLMASGADVDAPAATNVPALAAAIRRRDNRMVRYLLDMGADPSEKALIEAVHSEVEMMQLVLDNRLARYKRLSLGFGCRAIRAAILDSKTQMVEVLLRSGVNPNHSVWVPGLADWCDCSLIDYGDYVDDDRSDCSADSTDEVTRRRDEYHECESCLGTAIRFYLRQGPCVARMLLQAGANPEGIVHRHVKLRALGAAIHKGDARLVEMLLTAGASANAEICGDGRRTALQLAAERGKAEVVKLLLKHGAEVNAPAHWKNGATALQFAAMHGYLGIASTLVDEGADVNAAGAEKGGRTALEGAAEHGRINVVQFLLNAGAQVIGSGSKQYERAVELAVGNGHRAVRRLLEKVHSEKVVVEELWQAGGSQHDWSGGWEM